MDKLLNVAGFGYIIYALLLALFILNKIIAKITIIKNLHEVDFSSYLPLIVFGLIGLLIIILIAILAYFLNKRIHWKASLVLTLILLITFPIGTFLGIFTGMLLFRKDIQKQFTS
jgi:uncharacterized membrane protein YfcA